jgi:ATP-dependent helicase/nuclease subunit B
MDSTATLTALLALLDAGETLVLPTGCAARELRAAFNAKQEANGLSAWQPARAISWQQWTTSLYNELIVNGVETRLLLNTAQERSLWSAIIAADPPAGLLSSNHSIAELSASAFQLAAAWNATSQLTATAASDDTRTFARWARVFEERSEQGSFLSAAMLDTILNQHVTANTLPAPRSVRLVGFEIFTRSQHHLLDALRNRETEIARIQPVTENCPSRHFTFMASTPREELAFSAQWLRQQLASQNPAPRIAVLNPNLSDERADFEAILRKVVAPELQSIDADLSSTPWEFSIGAPLNSIALIADALDLTRWSITTLPQARVSALLLSPYLNAGKDREHAAELDARIRRRDKRLRPELSLSNFLGLLDDHHSALAWPRQLAAVIARAGDLTRPRTYAAWMEFVRHLVQATNWASVESRSLNPVEFEATRAWDGILDLVSTLDFSGQRVSLDIALEALERQAQSTDFIPPSTNAPIQIMHPSEMEGAIFDTVLFLHATDANLPAIKRTHPLLSWTLQSSLGMPGTDPVRSVADSRTAMQALLDRTGTALFLAASGDENGDLRPSPVLSEFFLPTTNVLLPVAAADSIDYEIIPDDQPLPALASAEVHGGSRLLQLQAACGFRAFAELRLNSTEPDIADIGLDAMESGTIVHLILQQLWTRLESQAELAALDPDERRDLLELCIADALGSQSTAIPWDEAYISVIRERLLRLMTAWIDIELRRGPFVIQGRELEEEVQVGPLKIKVRVDRIDGVLSIEDGERKVTGSVLVDYKTGGSASPKQWGVPRPEEPQLPLYTLLFEPGEVKGITFAKLIAGEDMRWYGMQSEIGILPSGRARDRIDDLSLRIEEWRDELVQLASHFAEGHTGVSPKDPIQTCQFCAQRILCRVNEITLTTGTDTEEDDGDE